MHFWFKGITLSLWLGDTIRMVKWRRNTFIDLWSTFFNLWKSLIYIFLLLTPGNQMCICEPTNYDCGCLGMKQDALFRYKFWLLLQLICTMSTCCVNKFTKVAYHSCDWLVLLQTISNRYISISPIDSLTSTLVITLVGYECDRMCYCYNTCGAQILNGSFQWPLY